MIRRQDGADFLLIRQDDHAALSGRLAARLGGGLFEAPEPRDLVMRAIAMHDAGWPLHDDQPTVNENDQPRNVFETPAGLAVEIWTASSQAAAAVDPYVGLLVSLHGLYLSASMLSAGAIGKVNRSAHDLFALNQFQHNQVELQERLRGQLGLRVDLPLKYGLAESGRSAEEDLLRFNALLLRAMDSLSLNACFGRAMFQTITGVHPGPGKPAITLEISPNARDGLTVEPWPFDQDELLEEIAAKRASITEQWTDDKLRRAIAEAPVEHVECRFGRSAKSRNDLTQSD